MTLLQTIPPSASRIRSMAHVNGKNGLITWKNFGNNTTGYVPPEPAICKTSITITIDLPTSPNMDTNVYTMVIKIKLQNNPKNTNHIELAIYTSNKNISPVITIKVCKIPNKTNNNNVPK